MRWASQTTSDAG